MLNLQKFIVYWLVMLNFHMHAIKFANRSGKDIFIAVRNIFKPNSYRFQSIANGETKDVSSNCIIFSPSCDETESDLLPKISVWESFEGNPRFGLVLPLIDQECENYIIGYNEITGFNLQVSQEDLHLSVIEPAAVDMPSTGLSSSLTKIKSLLSIFKKNRK